eukprot:Nitzschia sp. Nitz4//scaffold291_size36643//25170//26588//NITZ4_007767-RA/size36643-processed-gene-0.21-mRNA-1//1//CDS//3329546139//3423//frame0
MTKHDSSEDQREEKHRKLKVPLLWKALFIVALMYLLAFLVSENQIAIAVISPLGSGASYDIPTTLANVGDRNDTNFTVPEVHNDQFENSTVSSPMAHQANYLPPMVQGVQFSNNTEDTATVESVGFRSNPANITDVDDNSSNGTTWIPFQRLNGVVIATKIHGAHQLPLLEQSLCLLHHAYNNKPMYDIVVFTTLPIPDEMLVSSRNYVHPVNLTVVVDNRGLQEEIAALSPTRRTNFLQACNVAAPQNLTWFSNCPGRIAYNWQAEFRSWHIWKHPALAQYRYMMWLDTDAFCTKEWDVDPIHMAVENNLAILFDNWPNGRNSGKEVQRRIRSAFNVSLCNIDVKDGHFKSHVSAPGCKGARIPNVHGFFHITNLDFFRSPVVQGWAEKWIGDGFLQRTFDDQAAVTVPTAILAPEKSWDLRRKGVRLEVFHNLKLDGKKSKQVGGFKQYWESVVIKQFPSANVCPINAAV